MTEKTQPTDAELDMLIDDVAGLDSSNEAFRKFARAVLAKWGRPAQAEEPVARLVIESLNAQLHAAKQINAAQFGLLAASIPGSALRVSHGQAPTGANENAKLVTLIAECRDAFPIPAHGDPIENYWSAAIEDPANVPAYLQEIAKRKQTDSVLYDPKAVAWLNPWRADQVTTDYDAYGRRGIPLYTAPQPVERVPLTDEQIAEMMRDTWGCASIAPRHALEFARVVERAHGIKGANHDR